MSNDIFSDFQSAPNTNANANVAPFNSPSITTTVHQQRSLSQQNFSNSHFDTNDFSKFVQKPHPETFNANTYPSNRAFSANISSPSLTSSQRDLFENFSNPQSRSTNDNSNNLDGLSNHSNLNGGNGFLNNYYNNNNSNAGNNVLPSTDPFNLNSFSHVSTTPSQSAKGLGHEKKISFDTAFSDLDPLKSKW